jgi:RNA polymerase sigma factor (sigma-70 family)
MNDEPLPSNSLELLKRWRSGDERAAAEIYDAYVRRLIGLARSRLSQQFSKRFDPEDVVMSAYRSFFVRARDGEFVLEKSGDLWRLLAAITIRKTLAQIEHHRAGKRRVDGEDSLASQLGVVPERLTREPTPDEAVGLIDCLQHVLQAQSAIDRRILELRLAEGSTDEIAVTVGRSPRTVRRALERIQAELEACFQSVGDR